MSSISTDSMLPQGIPTPPIIPLLRTPPTPLPPSTLHLHSTTSTTLSPPPTTPSSTPLTSLLVSDVIDTTIVLSPDTLPGLSLALSHSANVTIDASSLPSLGTIALGPGLSGSITVSVASTLAPSIIWIDACASDNTATSDTTSASLTFIIPSSSTPETSPSGGAQSKSLTLSLPVQPPSRATLTELDRTSKLVEVSVDDVVGIVDLWALDRGEDGITFRVATSHPEFGHSPSLLDRYLSLSELDAILVHAKHLSTMSSAIFGRPPRTRRPHPKP